MLFQLTSSRRGWQLLCGVLLRMQLFQLTSSRRGWHPLLSCHQFRRYFNSHPHEEDDQERHECQCLFLISTHILTKRMTGFGWFLGLKRNDFNSHPHEEDDPASWIPRSSYRHFNSHPHEEDDLVLSAPRLHRCISTHILTKRMTYERCEKAAWLIISTHILTKRMTKTDGVFHDRGNISTHILTKRMTTDTYNYYIDYIISTHILTKRMTMLMILIV